MLGCSPLFTSSRKEGFGSQQDAHKRQRGCIAGVPMRILLRNGGACTRGNYTIPTIFQKIIIIKKKGGPQRSVVLDLLDPCRRVATLSLYFSC